MSKNTFAGTLMSSFSLKVETHSAPADVQLLTILPVCVQACNS
jgi:hypothetical protein